MYEDSWLESAYDERYEIPSDAIVGETDHYEDSTDYCDGCESLVENCDCEDSE